ncbi:MarR family winged helix-turn-helix transcriptional regulator [Phenylobacterium sp.]|uniref:MarR family winged helix-turn-helix transcriptional regulator n=1 Tax=Phenylobacterium sp. TaxID=1871053 RepID=UPI0027159D36|nr:MarR family winged helix-turn-helix transcriptional regulator [Phenylobacterium sp.]MDO8379642.1 MarR family winged helix-turn-helix transcriptional regulator [Phenylobacterium sp.]
MPPVSPKAAPVIDLPADVDLGVLKDVIGFRIRRIQNHLSRSFIDRINRKEVRPGVFSALALIAANPGLSQTTLAREIGFDKATVVALLDSLERLGWAERQRSTEDRRRHSLYVTPVGEKALEDLREVAVINEAKIHVALSKDERAQLFGLLDKLYVACFADEEI